MEKRVVLAVVLTIAVIFLTLLVSPLWIMPFRRAFTPVTGRVAAAPGS